jgi:hypothetical protein
LTLGLVGGCADLPTSGDVRQGITETPTDIGYPQFVPQDPAAGADPAAIVQGFLLATQAGPAEDFAAAGRFLTPAAAAAWEPLGEVNLYSDARPPEPVAPLEADPAAETVEVRVPFDLVGTMNGDGRYAPTPAAANSQSFTVARDDEGKWRISVAPAGILLSLGEFVTQFRAATAYFIDTSGRTLVPDVRWFTRAGAAAGIVEAFLAGPPEWLAATTRNPVPSGVSAGVSFGDGEAAPTDTAVVTLSNNAVGVKRSERERIVAALTAALLELPGVTRVEVVCRGERWMPPPSNDPSTVTRNRDGEAYLVEREEDGRDRLVGTDGEGLEPIEGFDLGALDSLASLTVSADGGAIAGLDGRGHVIRVHRDEGATQQVVADAGGVAPMYDSNGRLWTGMPSYKASGVASYPRLGAGTEIEVPWLEGQTLLSLAPAPDALRLALISREDTGLVVRVHLAAIERDARGVPVALGPPTLIASLSSAPTGAVWVDQLTVALLVAEGAALAPTPQLLMVGGLVSPLRAPSGGVGSLVGIAAGPESRDLLVVTESGGLFARVGARWDQRAQGVRLAAFPV